MGIFSSSTPSTKTLAIIQSYNECFADVLEPMLFIAEKLEYLNTTKDVRKLASLVARNIRIARKSSDKKAQEIIRDFYTALEEQVDMLTKLGEQYKIKYGKEFDVKDLELAKKSGWKLI